MKNDVLRAMAAMAAAAVLLAASGCNLLPAPPTSPTSSGPPPPPIDTTWTPPAFQQTSPQPGLSTLVENVRPWVVSINVKLTSTNIFGQITSQEGAGSGWVIDDTGLIVTNNHVVTGAQDIEVTLSDGSVFPAVEVVADQVTDLAVVKINATGLTAAKVGDSSQMKVGMEVAAIGNALGQGISVTAGWISRLGASITVTSISETLYDLIETSAPINPGNSGGPLINMDGEVIGITNAKLVASGVEAVGYAISTKDALPIIQQLVQTGYVVRPYFGVGLETVNAAVAAVYGLSVNSGALITSVASGSPASNAGLKAGDVITQIDNKGIADASQGAEALQATQIGQPVTITYWSGNTEYSVQITPIQNPQL